MININSLNERISVNKILFIESVKLFYEESKTNYKRAIFDFLPKRYFIENEFVNKDVFFKEKIEYFMEKDYSVKYSKNKNILNYYIDFDFKEHYEILEFNFSELIGFKNQFFKSLDNLIYKKFELYSNFNIFVDIVSEKPNLTKIFNLNIDSFLSYVENLIMLNFNEFNILQVEKNHTYFVKILNHEYSLAIVLNKKKYTDELKVFNIGIERFIELILIKKGFNFKKSFELQEETCFLLGNCYNPFFYFKIPNFDYFISVIITKYDESYRIQRFKKDNVFFVVHPELLKNEFKEYIFYYFRLFFETSINYIEFLEKSICDVLKSKDER